jgi:hypothetical protein
MKDRPSCTSAALTINSVFVIMRALVRFGKHLKVPPPSQISLQLIGLNWFLDAL